MSCRTCRYLAADLPPSRLYLDDRRRHILADVRCPDCGEVFTRTAQPHPAVILTPDCTTCLDRLAAHPELVDGVAVSAWGGVRGDDFSHL